MKVLFISSYKIRCGIASFTETLESLLASEVDCDVFPLDQFLLRNKSYLPARAGDAEIRRLCDEVIPKFDVISLQWEPGLLGLTNKQILRRTRMIFAASIAHKKHLVITAHTVVSARPRSAANSGRWRALKAPLAVLRHTRQLFGSYEKTTHQLLRWVDREGKLTLIAHTPRDRRFFQYVVGLKRVLDHPLSCMHADWPEVLRNELGAKRKEFETIAGAGKKYMVIYGFLSEYKGIETAIKAMWHLPRDYALLIYGAVHPGALKPREKVNPYVKQLMDLVRGDGSSPPVAAKPASEPSAQTPAGGPDARTQQPAIVSKSLIDRVFFVEAPDDLDLARVVSAADFCVLSHVEVGQSASGVASQAIELGKRTLLSRTRTFTELGDYFPKRVEFFETGNHVQLAQGVLRLAQEPEIGPAGLPYTNQTQKEFYKRAFQWK